MEGAEARVVKLLRAKLWGRSAQAKVGVQSFFPRHFDFQSAHRRLAACRCSRLSKPSPRVSVKKQTSFLWWRTSQRSRIATTICSTALRNWVGGSRPDPPGLKKKQGGGWFAFFKLIFGAFARCFLGLPRYHSLLFLAPR